MIRGIRTCLRISGDPMFQWIFSNSCPLNLLLVRRPQAEIIIVKRLIQARNSVTMWELNQDHAIRVVVKTMPLPIRPHCRQETCRIGNYEKKSYSSNNSWNSPVKKKRRSERGCSELYRYIEPPIACKPKIVCSDIKLQRLILLLFLFSVLYNNYII